MQEDFNPFVPNVRFEKIPIRMLVSNQDYQRNLSQSHVTRTADNFDLYQINPVKVSRRNGVNYVFNGQHTIEIVARVSGSRDTPVWCMIYDDLDYEGEADIFAKQQKYIKPLTPYEIFMANIEAGNEEQLIIKALVESYGLVLSCSYKTPGGICAISALEYIYNKYGLKVLDTTLYVTVSTWEGDPVSLAANMLKGIAKLIVAYGSALKLDQFVERLSRVSAKEITRSAKERQNGSMGFAEALLQIYNKRTKYPLSFNPLFKSRYGGDYEEAEQNPVSESIDEDQLTEIDEQSDQLSIDALIDQESDIQE